MNKLYKLKILRDTELKKKGDVINCNKKNHLNCTTPNFSQNI